MSIANYGELKLVVADFLHRSDLGNQMDTASQSVTQDINDSFKAQPMVNIGKLDDGDRLAVGSMEYQLPFASNDAAQAILSVYTGPGVPASPFGGATGTENNGVIAMSEQAVWDTLRKKLNVVTGYTLTQSTGRIRFSSVPAVGAEFLVEYRRIFYPFEDDSDTNSPLLNYPMLYVYGMCKYLSIFTQDIELALVFDRQFTQMIEQANANFRENLNTGPAQIKGASTWV